MYGMIRRNGAARLPQMGRAPANFKDSSMKIRKLAFLLTLGGLAMGASLSASALSCYHVLHATCPSAESPDKVAFVALTWAVDAGPDMADYESCAFSKGRQYDFHEYLANTDQVAELCNGGVVYREDVREFRRHEKFKHALRDYRKLAHECTDADGIFKCVIIEDLDLESGVGNVQVLLKNRVR